MAVKGKALVAKYTAWDTSAEAPKTGDAANHTLRWIKDGTSGAPTNAPVEIGDGEYKITLTTTETACDEGTIAGDSSTANVVIIPKSYTFIDLNEIADAWIDRQTTEATEAGSLGKFIVDSLTSLLNNTTLIVQCPSDFERPTTTARNYVLYLNVHDHAGNLEALDSAPTVAVTNVTGTDRSGNLQKVSDHTASTTMEAIADGRYQIEYKVDVGVVLEQLHFVFTVVEGSVTRNVDVTVNVTSAGAGGGDATAANQTTIITHLTDIKGTGFVKDTHSLPQCITADVAAVNALTHGVVVTPPRLLIPSAASSVYRIELFTYGPNGALKDVTTPTVTARNAGGDNRSANLGVVAKTANGHFTVTYTVASTHAEEVLFFDWSTGHTGSTTTETAVSGSFLAADRTKLEAIHTKLPSSAYLTGTANAAGYVDMATATGNFPGTVAGIAGSITTLDALKASLNDLNSASIQSACQAALAAYTVPTLSQMNARTLVSAAYATSANQLTAAQIAYGIFTYDVANAQNDAAINSLCTVVLGGLCSVRSDTTLTIYKTTGVVHTTLPLQTSATAEPIIAVGNV